MAKIYTNWFNRYSNRYWNWGYIFLYVGQKCRNYKEKSKDYWRNWGCWGEDGAGGAGGRGGGGELELGGVGQGEEEQWANEFQGE